MLQSGSLLYTSTLLKSSNDRKKNKRIHSKVWENAEDQLIKQSDWKYTKKVNNQEMSVEHAATLETQVENKKLPITQK